MSFARSCHVGKIPTRERRWSVVIIGARRKLWSTYRTSAEAESMAAQLRTHGFDARIEPDEQSAGAT